MVAAGLALASPDRDGDSGAVIGRALVPSPFLLGVSEGAKRYHLARMATSNIAFAA